MVKTGWRELILRPGEKTSIFCQACGVVARKRVTFEDNFGRLHVSLCDECAEKEYRELMLQGRFKWPGENLIDK